MFGANVKPAFQIKKLPDTMTFERVVMNKDKKTGKLVREVVTEKGGYMAFFPQGHSIRVRNEQHLEELKLVGGNNYQIDMDSGIVLPQHLMSGPANNSLEEHVARKTKATQGSIESEIDKAIAAEGDQ